jgi:hypothetical protein
MAISTSIATRTATPKRAVVSISNETEFGIRGVQASKVLAANSCRRNRLDLSPEVNTIHAIESKVSMAANVEELNHRLRRSVEQLSNITRQENGQLYGGGVIFEDVSFIEPIRYRTTSLSERCAKSFLDINGHQIIIGVGDQQLGFEIYNTLRNLNPVLLAISSSSPYTYHDGEVRETGYQSSRIIRYSKLLERFPSSMLESPQLNSYEEYFETLRSISRVVKERLRNGMLDANWEELTKIRTNEDGSTYSYYPFRSLEPHQIYWFARPRPDFVNNESEFVLELRVPDTPITISSMQTLNAFVIGLTYFIAKNGVESIPVPFNGTFDDISQTAKSSTSTQINNTNMSNVISTLVRYSYTGLLEEGFVEDATRVANINENYIKSNNTQAIQTAMRNSEKLPPSVIINYLAGELRK